MNKPIYSVLLFCIGLQIHYAQTSLSNVTVDKAITPTATVASLGKYGDKSGVDNKGKYNTSIDLASLKSGELNYNIGLSYSSNGLKINDWGARTGLLWSDNFTSAIYRTVRGQPDEYAGSKVTGLEGGSYTLDQYLVIKETADALENNNTAGRDGESDIFHYNIFGLTGSFVIVNGQVLQINYSEKLKIEVGSGYSSFTITLKNGNRYYFGNNNTIEYTTYDTQCNDEIAPLPKQKTAWFLTKIEDLNASNIINFTYGSISNYYTEDKSETITIKNKTYAGDAPCWNHQLKYLFAPNTCTRYKIFDTKYLTKVSSQDFTVDYLYTDREDIMTEKLLDHIEIKNQGNVIVNKIKFDYQKFGNNNGAAYNNWGYSVRYFLNKVSIGKNLDQKYTFTYNNLPQLPARFSYTQDLAGIYNGTVGSSFLPTEYVQKALPIFTVVNSPLEGWPIPGIPSSDRSPHFPQSTYGLMASIQYPTGGTENILYEPNTVIKDSNTPVESEFYGVRTKRIELLSNTGDMITKEYKYAIAEYDSINNNITFGAISSLFSLNDEFGGHVSSVYDAGQDTNCGGGGPYGSFYIDRYMKINSNKIYDINRFQGDFISYSDVTEVTNGKRFKIKKYITTEDWFTQPLLGELNSYSPNSEYFWFANLMSDQYEGEISNSLYGVKRFSRWGYDYKDYQFINNYVINRDYIPVNHFGTAYYTDNLNAYAVGKYIFPNRWYNNYKKSETTILEDGGKLTQETTFKYYDINGYNNLKSVENKYSDATTDRKDFTYSYTGDFQQNYMIGIPVKTEEYKNDKIIARTYYGFSKVWWHHEKLFPSGISKTNMNALIPDNEWTEEIKYDQYDNKGNLLQYTTKFGVPVTLLYGYNKTQPIAKIEGLDYTVFLSLPGLGVNASGYDNLEICQKSNADVDTASEETLLTALDNFRKNPAVSGYQITTYTYDPLVGVTSITSPSGVREKYIYDPYTNRLKEVKVMEKDSNGNYAYKISKEYQYNYKQ